MAIKNNAVRNLSALIGVQLINYILPLITIPFVVRIIGPAKFGSINYASVVIGYFILFIGFSFELSAVRLITAQRNNGLKLNVVFNRIFFAKVALFIISAFLFLSLLFFSHTFWKDRLIAIFTFLLCLGTVADSTWFLIGKQDIHKAAIFNLITKSLLNVSLLVFIRKQEDYILQPLIVSLSQVLVGFIAFYWTLKKYNLKIRFPGSAAVWDVIWKNKVLFFHSFSHTVYTTFNIVILGYLKGPLEVGFYTGGWKLIIIIQAIFISPLGTTLFPIIGQTFDKNKKEGLTIIQKSFPIIIIVTTFIAGVILLFGGTITTLLYGNKFNNSIHIFKLLSFMPMILALNMLLGIQTMVNLRMDKIFFAITISAAFINLILNLILISKWNASGAAVSWLLTELFCFILMYIILIRNKIQLLKPQYFRFSTIMSLLVPAIEKIKYKFPRNPF